MPRRFCAASGESRLNLKSGSVKPVLSRSSTLGTLHVMKPTKRPTRKRRLDVGACGHQVHHPDSGPGHPIWLVSTRGTSLGVVLPVKLQPLGQHVTVKYVGAAMPACTPGPGECRLMLVSRLGATWGSGAKHCRLQWRAITGSQGWPGARVEAMAVMRRT